MILTIDIGNTNIAFGIAKEGDWLEHWRLQTSVDKTADEYLVLFRDLVRDYSIGDVERIVISSVVPGLTPAIIEVTETLFGQPPLVVNHYSKTGLRGAVPSEMGNDLLANAVAAWDRYGRATIIADFGTALSFTVISGTGEVLGVSIAPGLRSALKALVGNTAQLHSVELVPPPQALGRTTITAIQSGLVYGYVGLVKELIARMTAEIGEKPFVVATGGLSGTIAPLCPEIDEVRPWHTLEGLLVLARLNPA